MRSKYIRHKDKPQGNLKEPFFNPASKVNAPGDTAFFQPKLSIGKTNDPLEKEADDVADQVLDNPQNQSPKTTELNRKPKVVRQEKPEEAEIAQTKPEILRQEKPKEEEMAQTKLEILRQEKPEEEEMAQTKPEILRQEKPEEEEVAQTKPEILRQEKPEEEEVQTKSIPGTQAQRREPKPESATATPTFEKKLTKTKGKGFVLPDDIKAEMEKKLGADLSLVRIHTGPEAIDLSTSISAQAFTHGYDIYFNAGKYQPETKEGQWLLAHELAHVLQQKGNKEK